MSIAPRLPRAYDLEFKGSNTLSVFERINGAVLAIAATAIDMDAWERVRELVLHTAPRRQPRRVLASPCLGRGGPRTARGRGCQRHRASRKLSTTPPRLRAAGQVRSGPPDARLPSRRSRPLDRRQPAPRASTTDGLLPELGEVPGRSRQAGLRLTAVVEQHRPTLALSARQRGSDCQHARAH